MYSEHNALGYRSSLALCLTKVRSSRACCPATALIADNTAVYLTMDDADSGRVLQNDLDTLSVWESRWDMEFNPSKCQVVRVTTSRNPINYLYHLHGGCHQC